MATSGRPKGYKHTEASKLKMSLIAKEKVKSRRSYKGINNPNYGKHPSKEVRHRIGSANRGRQFSDTHKEKLSEKAKKVVHTPSWNENMRKALAGKIPVSIQREGQYGNVKRGYYDINGKRMFFRSKWEANYALYLDFLVEIKQVKLWEYESDVFIFEKIKFGTRSYRPDFKVITDTGKTEYHEVKGWMDSKSKTKLNRMRIYYPKEKIILIEEESYADIKGKVGRMLGFY